MACCSYLGAKAVAATAAFYSQGHYLVISQLTYSISQHSPI